VIGGFALFGRSILGYLQVGLPALQGAGGLRGSPPSSTGC
jgi:small neutral amino acid transporter SnatA (MarC family)